MIAASVVFVYLILVIYVGIFAFRRKESKEEFFVANRSLGTFVFLMSLFGSNMTAFAILGSSGLASRLGVGVYGLMASISGIIIPMSIFLIGTRLWSIGKRFGHITQVQILRDRFEMGHIGTVVFVLQAIMLVPYIIIGVMGGGETLEGVSGGQVPYWFGGLIVALVVMSYVFFGGMRGTALVNTLQTSMFLVFGTIAFFVIANGMGGIGATVEKMAATLDQAAAAAPAAEGGKPPGPPPVGELLTRDRIAFWQFASYLFIPLSSIMFPHIAIFCLTAKKMASFRKTVIFYPICIMAIWLPSVFLGAVSGGRDDVVAGIAADSREVVTWVDARGDVSKVQDPEKKFKLPALLAASKNPAAAALLSDIQAGKIDSSHESHVELSKRLLEIGDPPIKGELRRLAAGNSDGTMLELLAMFAPAWLAGLLGAAIMACVMASDSQILALSTMFSEDVFAYYGGRNRYGEKAEIWAARIFVVCCTIIAYIIAIAVHQAASIFEIAIQFAFSGYASMAPIMLGCLFWRRATCWGVLLSTLWVAACLIVFGYMQATVAAPQTPTAAPIPIWQLGGFNVFIRDFAGIRFTDARMLVVVPMFLGSALLMIVGSLLTAAPSRGTIDRYFPARTQPVNE